VLAQLIPLAGGEPITIDRDVTVVGREREHCDLLIQRKSVSKLHCVIVKTDGLLFVRDLSSTNGTKVNGQRIMRGALLPGDQLSFAGEKFRVQMGPALAPGVVSPEQRTQVLDVIFAEADDDLPGKSKRPLTDEDLVK
jgi:pSer/pThr/pTyr-binding forkhead associated (FHA) protein